MLKQVELDQKKYSGFCKLHGNYDSFKTKVFGKWQGGKCPTCMANKADEMENSKMVFDSQLPKRFKLCSFENYTVGESLSQKRAYAWCKKYAENFKSSILANGTSLAFTGSCGTGKTHLASSIANHIIKNKHGICLYTKVYEVMASIKGSWSDKNRSEDEAIKEYTKPDLLIIDEIGVQFGTPAEELILFRLLNKRYEDMKPTIVLSNLNERGLIDYLGERVVDRFYECNGGVLAFDWQSHRRVKS